MNPKAVTRRSTAIGAVAILLWSSQALLTTATGSIPPFQLSAMAFAIGGVAGFIILLIKETQFKTWKQPKRVWLLGVWGLFTYHALYFLALKNAPPTEASLVGYLWPLLIVIFATFLPGAKLHIAHLIGAFLGLAGAVLIVTRGEAMDIDPSYTFGFVCALASAVVWAIYSVASRSFANVPSEIITAFCLATSALSILAHLIFEESVWPLNGRQWLAILGLGLGPLGLAFTVWDIGMKHGNISLLGTASYATPLLSTLLLVIFGVTPATPLIAAAAILITIGAVIAALPSVNLQ